MNELITNSASDWIEEIGNKAVEDNEHLKPAYEDAALAFDLFALAPVVMYNDHSYGMKVRKFKGAWDSSVFDEFDIIYMIMGDEEKGWLVRGVLKEDIKK